MEQASNKLELTQLMKDGKPYCTYKYETLKTKAKSKSEDELAIEDIIKIMPEAKRKKVRVIIVPKLSMGEQSTKKNNFPDDECSVQFVERVSPTPCKKSVVEDHCYTNTKLQYQNDIDNNVQQAENSQKPLRQPQPVREYNNCVRDSSGRVCDSHPYMFELKHEALVKAGDKFASPKELTLYLNKNAKDWLFYYHCVRSQVQCKMPNYLMTCIYSKPNGNNYKSKGLRKRVNRDIIGWYSMYPLYARRFMLNVIGGAQPIDVLRALTHLILTCEFPHDVVRHRMSSRKPPIGHQCPCRIVLTRLPGDDHYTVTFVCNHHDHELTEEAFNKLPHSRRLSPDVRNEIADFITLGLDLGIVQKYVQSITGFLLTRSFFLNFSLAMKKKNVERQFSVQRLKQLSDKIISLKEIHGAGDTKDKDVDKGNVNKDKNQIFSTLSPIATNEKPTQKSSRKKRKDPCAKTETEQVMEIFKRFSKDNLSRRSSKRNKTTTEDTVNNIANRSKRKRSKCSKEITEKKDVYKRSRLETRLDNLSDDQEVLQSVKQLQEGYGIQSLNPTKSDNPTTTNSNIVSTQNPCLLQQEHDANDISKDHDIFSGDYYIDENNDNQYETMEINQHEDISSSVVNYEDVDTDNYINGDHSDVHNEDNDTTNEMNDVLPTNDNEITQNQNFEFDSVNSNDLEITEIQQNENVDSTVHDTLSRENSVIHLLNQEIVEKDLVQEKPGDSSTVTVKRVYHAKPIKIRVNSNANLSKIIKVIDNQLIKGIVGRCNTAAETQHCNTLNDVSALRNVDVSNHIEQFEDKACLLQQEPDTNDIGEKHGVFSGYCNVHENNDNQYEIMEINQHEDISNNVVNYEDVDTDDYINGDHFAVQNEDNGTPNDMNDVPHTNDDKITQNEHFEFSSVNSNGLDSTDIQQKENIDDNLTVHDTRGNENSLNHLLNQERVEKDPIKKVQEKPDDSSTVTVKRVYHATPIKIRVNSNPNLSKIIKVIDSQRIKGKVGRCNTAAETQHCNTVIDVDALRNVDVSNHIKQFEDKDIQTDEGFFKKDINISNTASNDEPRKSITDIEKDIEHEETTIEYINKYNIGQYIVQSHLHKYIEKIGEMMSMSMCSLFSNIYSGKATIKMIASYKSKSKLITMSYVAENSPSIDNNKNTNNRISNGKSKFNSYYCDLMAARHKLSEKEKKVDILNIQLKFFKENGKYMNEKIRQLQKEISNYKIEIQVLKKLNEKVENSNSDNYKEISSHGLDKQKSVNNEIINSQNVVSTFKIEIQDLKNERNQLTVILEELYKEGSSIIHSFIKPVKERLTINESHQQEQKQIFITNMQELVFRNLIILHSLNNKIKSLQHEHDNLVNENNNLLKINKRHRNEIENLIGEKKKEQELWFKRKEHQIFVESVKSLQEYVAISTEEYINVLSNMLEKKRELTRFIDSAKNEIMNLEQVRDNLKREIDNLNKNKMKFLDRISNVTTISRLQCMQRKIRNYVEHHKENLRDAVDYWLTLNGKFSENACTKNPQTQDLANEKDPLDIEEIKSEGDSELQDDKSLESENTIKNLIHELLLSFAGDNPDYRNIARNLKRDLLEELMDDISV